jgi:hypothetical protein
MGPDPLKCPVTGEYIREGDKVELSEDAVGTMGFDEAFEGRWVIENIIGESEVESVPVNFLNSSNFGLKKISKEEYDSRALELS